MYGEFVWWQGVVEDRVDPLKLGRCRVRILGYHTNNKERIPTQDLPWAYPSQPITSAAMNGVGTTPMGPVEGTWVFGFFRDGPNAQEPVITGTFGGIPEAEPNPTLGFNDPKGKYPLTTHILEPDTNRLARGSGALPVPDSEGNGPYNGENSPSLIQKRKARQMEVPVGVVGHLWDYDKDKGTIKHTDNTKLYDVAPWNEPNPRYGGVEDSNTTYLESTKRSSQYPLNHVRMSESGHVEEWDDTPTAERMHRYHSTGTFEEIQADGTKITKIVGNEYEITAGYKDVWIKGSVNITIGSKGDADVNKSDCRILYYGDLVQEVYGDYHLNVHGDMRTKISGNEAREVLADRKIVINGEDDLSVHKNQIINIDDNLTYTIGGNLKETVKKNVDENYGNGVPNFPPGNHTTLVYGSSMLSNVTGKYTLTVKDDMKISTTANYNLNVTGNTEIEVEGYQDEIIQGYDNHIVNGYYQMSNALTHQISSGGNYSVTAPRIDLN
ncbi:uncharacterized protein METZ01_LOCUS66601 [marine metagenome]|uniref:Protein Gp5 N-terminal OB-fold domain-containing protein n=1 Tax=marine metagenome TaxID=408172 RepID=A0A381TG66_9ZZZZ